MEADISSFSGMEQENKITVFSNILTLKDLISVDIWGAFAGYQTMEEAYDTGLIPKGFEAMVFNNKGEVIKCSCGAERIISSNRADILCTNPKCNIKRSYRMEGIFKNFGVEGIGDMTCTKIIDYQEEKSDGTIFSMLFDTDFCSEDFGEATTEKILDGINTIRNSKLTFLELLKKIRIPGVEAKVDSLFKRYNDLDEILDDINRFGKISFFTYNGTNSPRIMFNVCAYLEEILSAYDHMVVNDRLLTFSGDSVDIVMTNSINDFNSRSAYVQFLNEMLTLPNGHRVLTVKEGKARNTTDYFVIDDFGKSSKTIEVAREREKNEERKLIYSSEEFSAIMYQYRLQIEEELNNG